MVGIIQEGDIYIIDSTFILYIYITLISHLYHNNEAAGALARRQAKPRAPIEPVRASAGLAKWQKYALRCFCAKKGTRAQVQL